MTLPKSTFGLSPRRLNSARHQQGYTLMEILVAIFIGVFLLVGLFTILQNTRRTSTNQSGLAQLQDEERMAMSVLADVIQNAGYFDPSAITAAAALPAVAGSGLATGNALVAGQGLSGKHAASTDIILARYATNGTDGIINCQGGPATAPFSSTFYIKAITSAGVSDSALYCSTDGTGSSGTNGVPLALGVWYMQAYYGVSSTATTNNVDTYLTATEVQASALGWAAVTSVRITLGFKNPLAGQAGYTAAANQYIYLTRVISLQGRTGVIATAL